MVPSAGLILSICLRLCDLMLNANFLRISQVQVNPSKLLIALKDEYSHGSADNYWFSSQTWFRHQSLLILGRMFSSGLIYHISSFCCLPNVSWHAGFLPQTAQSCSCGEYTMNALHYKDKKKFNVPNFECW